MIDEQSIAKAVARLREGSLVAVPTETVYGLAADAHNEEAVRLLLRTKGRPTEKALPVVVAEASAARTLVAQWPDRAQAWAEAFWPGPLTIVLPKAAEVAEAVTAGKGTIGVRCPDHVVALALLQAFGGPVALSSCNVSGATPARSAKEARQAFPEVLALDNPLSVDSRGASSTVVELLCKSDGQWHASILREGPISAAALGL